MQKMTICLGYESQAEQAVNFYCSIFKDAEIKSKSIVGENEFGGAPGSVRTISFSALGQNFVAVNGGSYFANLFNDGVSFMINCETQEEIDYYWSKLTADGGKEVQCGWLKDKYGMSWQVVPAIMAQLMGDSDQKKSQRVMQEVLKMKKLDIATLKKAYDS